MIGLRTCEGKKFEKFFELVQQEAKKKGGVFFADCGEGNEFSNDHMEGENLSGWLIPIEIAEEFEKEFLEKTDPEGWDKFLCWALWENADNPKISFDWCKYSSGF